MTNPEQDPAGAADLEVMTSAAEWLRAGRRVALVTVIHTWGSSPRPPGSLLAMHDGGRFVGSVSGGCVESDLVARFQAGELGEPLPTRIDYGVDRREAGRLGLPCGGRLELLVEELAAAAPIERLLQRLQAGELVARRVCLETGEVSLHGAAGRLELELTPHAVSKVFGPAWQLLLVGDGQLARYLARMALMLDYRVTLCDPRGEFADPPPQAGVRYLRQMPDDAVRRLTREPRCAVVTLTHDPRQDDLALCAALESDAFYIGALGSTRSAAARCQRLASLGYSTEQIARIHAPAGLPIGSKRPAEIALSILAQVTARRNALSAASREPQIPA